MPESPNPPVPVFRWAESLLAWRHWLAGAVLLLLLGLVLGALNALTRELHYADILDAIRQTGHTELALAALATALSYLTLTGYDRSSLRYVGVTLPYRVIAETSFIAYALGNTIGLGALTGGAVRLRMYGAAGVEAGAISRAIAFNALAFGLGVSVIGATALLWGAPAVAAVARCPVWVLQLMASLVLVGSAGLLALCARPPASLPFGLRLPSLPLALQQLAISALDIAAAGAVLWVLLPAGAPPFPVFLGFYAIALVLGVISHVPGGLGVFEAVMLVGLGTQVAPQDLTAALVLYRVIYFLLPLALALLMLVLHELREGVAAPVGRAAASLSPLLLTAFTLIVSVMLLVSGVTPATDEATELLAVSVPLPLVEASHFLGSIAGLALLLVARGMLQRLDAAWWAGLGLALLSLLLAFPKGIAWSEAALLSFLAVTLVLSRKQFTRKASLLAQPFTVGWWLAIGAILAVLVGVLFFAYRDVEYGQQLWWQFEFDGHAPRSLRALVAVGLIVLVLALRQLLRPPKTPLALPDAAILERASAIVRQQEFAGAGLALTGDKHFLFSETGRSFVMFGQRGRTFVGLYDPVGPAAEHPELVWRLLEQARESGGRASFYQIRPRALPVYLDAGLKLFKLGEEAYVRLPEFSLKGNARANLRAGMNRGEREGLRFELVPAAEVATRLPQLRPISDAWLDQHQTAEKSFSLGAFNDRYLSRQPVAVAYQESRPVAFATVLTTELKIEVSVDLMRQRPDAPRGTMDFLFAKLLLHFQAQGFQRFSLGMAPLSGMAAHPLASNWHRFGRLLFAHGENFYNFQGLRAFKEKFDPEWEARYLAAPGGLTPLLVLADIAALISGGLKGVFAK